MRPPATAPATLPRPPDQGDGEPSDNEDTTGERRDRKQGNHQSAAKARQHATIDKYASDVASHRYAH